MKYCINCKKSYQYITEFEFEKNRDEYEPNQIGISRAYCLYCQQDLFKEEMYAFLMKMLGNSSEERRNNFKRIIPTVRKLKWMTWDNKLPSDLCPHCGIRLEKEAYRDGSGPGVNFRFCSKECLIEFQKLPRMDTILGKDKEDFTCVSENHSEYMYRQYDQLYRKQDKEIQEVDNKGWEPEQAEYVKEQYRKAKKRYFENMKIYKDLWDKDKKYGSIDRMLKGVDI